VAIPPSAVPPPLCPSAQPEWEGSVAIGVVGGTSDEPRLSHFESAAQVDDDLLALATPVSPAEVFRFAAPCLCTGCVHFEDDECHLAKRIVQTLPVVARRLPKCSIRPRCRWWQQEGSSACARCPQVVTDNYNPSDEMRQAAYGPT
jgi:hypothetical protein